MAQYIAACISFKKVICERELSFIEQIGRVQLNKKQLVYDLKNNHFKKIEEDNTTYFVVSNVNYLFSNNPNHLWGPTIELEGKAHSIHEANIIAKNAYENKFKSSSNRDDETDFEINFAIQDNEPLKIYSKKIRNSHGSGILFLTIIGIELKKLDGYKYICFGATTIGEGPEIGYHSQLPSYYRSKDEVIKTISTFEDDDTQFIDKDANNLSIEIQDDLAEPFGIIKFFEI